MIFGGLFVNLETIPAVFSWIQVSTYFDVPSLLLNLHPTILFDILLCVCS
jgi:hypothetical protein